MALGGGWAADTEGEMMVAGARVMEAAGWEGLMRAAAWVPATEAVGTVEAATVAVVMVEAAMEAATGAVVREVAMVVGWFRTRTPPRGRRWPGWFQRSSPKSRPCNRRRSPR